MLLRLQKKTVSLLCAGLFSLPALLNAADAGQNPPDASNASADHAPPDGPFYPGAPKSSSRLQGTLGDYTLRFYGTLLLNISTSGTVQVGQDIPLWPLPGSSPVTFPDGTTRRAGSVGEL